MIVLPAITRELRAQSRLASTYALRVLGAFVPLGVSVFFAFRTGFLPSKGGELFAFLNSALFFATWLIVPLLAADCISSERREGTLGLLFMTPLKSRDIVVAKSFVHGLRALSLLLAVIPIMSVPFLMGGVSWREAVCAALVNLSSLAGALAAGLLASCVSKRWLRAQILACVLGVSFATVFVYLTGCLTISLPIAGMTSRLPQRVLGVYLGQTYNAGVGYDLIMARGFQAATDWDGFWGRLIAARGAAAPSSWLMAGVGVPLFSILFLGFVIELAAWRLRRVWREEPPSARQLWLESKLLTPVVGVSFLRAWMRRKLEHNPIGWLEQRTWSGRLVTWSWFAVMVSLYSAGLGGRYYSFHVLNNLQNLMGWLLLLGMASSAAGSFQRERETGVMELLLVSPMTEGQIIGGRVRGLYSQFLPAVLLYFGVWLYFKGIMSDWSDRVEMQFVGGACLILPVVGLYYSLRRKTFIAAFLSTILVGLLLPLILAGMLNFFLPLLLMDGSRPGAYGFDDYAGALSSGGSAMMFRRLAASAWFLTLLQLAVAARCGWRLYRDLKRRNFGFSRTTA